MADSTSWSSGVWIASGATFAMILTLVNSPRSMFSFVSLGEGIDTGTPAGRLQRHILGAIAEFERARIAERVKAGVERARRQGRRLGRPEREVLIQCWPLSGD